MRVERIGEATAGPSKSQCKAMASKWWSNRPSYVLGVPAGLSVYPRLVAVHVWHRTNTNRPDNYEPAFEFHVDGRKRASRVLPYCVIAPGLTGIVATGHPTEKHVGLMRELVKRTSGVVLDPFLGSGATGVAAVTLGRKFIGCEINPRWFDIACRRIEAAYAQPDLFVSSPAPKPEQLSLLGAAE